MGNDIMMIMMEDIWYTEDMMTDMMTGMDGNPGEDVAADAVRLN
jgi:hypothetical protein